VNRSELTTPVSDGFQWAKKAGVAWRERVRPGDRVADRKPFFAFYAGATYTPIPIAPYQNVMEHLVSENVRFLMLHRPTIETLRPALVPLLESRELIQGEIRFQQADVVPGVYALYERTGVDDTLARKRITRPTGGVLVVPSWSPDGRWVAYRSLGPEGPAGLFVVPAEGGGARRVMAGPGVNDPVSWSPDSERIALAVPSEDRGLYIAAADVTGTTIERLTEGGAIDRSPSWSGDGKEVVFSSKRTGRDEIWSVDTVTREETRITADGPNTFPALSPGGDRVAWISDREGLVILDRASGRRCSAGISKKVSFAPSWSPDGRFIAVTAEAQSGMQVYLLTSDGTNALMLTKSTAGNGMPSWGPDGQSMVVVTNEEGDYGLWVLTGLGPYLDRLLSPLSVTTVGASE
jgi:Tol biopolymer transport system component